jgi:chain length determinant protein EpsF
LFAGATMASMMMPSFMATQVDMLQSERVALRAIRSLGLSQNTELREQWLESTEGRGDFESWLAVFLQKNFDVKPSRESNVLTASYTSASPEFSAAMANAMVQGYIATTLDLKVEPARQYSAFFDERAKKLRDSLEAAQTRLSAYQRKNGLLATDERFDIETARLNELSSQLVLLQAAAAETSGRQAQVGANADRLSEVLNNPLIASLSADASRLEAKLKEMNARFGDEHPQVIETRANIAELRSRIATESARVSGSLGVNNSVNQSRVAQVQAALAAQRTKVLKLKEQRDEAIVLQRDVESAQRTYDTVLGRASQTSLESQNTQTNVSLLREATPPAEPSSPKLLLNTAMAIFLGGLLALATILLRELMDRRVRGSVDITEMLQQPLLGTLPAVRLSTTPTVKRLALLQRRAANNLVQS